jgi:hypothetical protein
MKDKARMLVPGWWQCGSRRRTCGLTVAWLAGRDSENTPESCSAIDVNPRPSELSTPILWLKATDEPIDILIMCLRLFRQLQSG